MREDEKKEEKKVYDFTHCCEEVSIGMFVESDLSKTVANYIYQHTSDLATDEFARELFRNGKVAMTENEVMLMRKNIEDSQLIISVKRAVLDLLKS